MQNLSKYILLIFISLIAANSGLAQISYGGLPLMNAGDFNPEEVLYLLAPEEPLALEAAKSLKYNRVKKIVQYAVEREVDLSPEFNGGWSQSDNLKIWRAHIISPQAYSLGVLFSEFELNEGVKIFIYDESGEHIKGAFTSENNKEYGTFYVGHIPGEQLIIEMQVDQGVSDYGQMRIGSISHAIEPVFASPNKSDLSLGTSQDCEIDINCIEGEDWQIIKKSVCQISTPTLLCTGVLVNNTSYDGKPYILTAEHCVNSKFYAENSVFTFHYENSECGIDDAEMNMSVSGSSFVSTGDSIDFTLVKLSSMPPQDYDLYYAGWDIRAINHNSSVTIHHPDADAMKISYDFDPMISATSTPWPEYITESYYKINEWDIGTTEGGSSGSPLFNSGKKLIGVLTGGSASCGDSIGYDEINDRTIFLLDGNVDDYYSRLYYGWNHYSSTDQQLKRWLDPKNTGQLSIGGLSQMAVEVSHKLIGNFDLQVYPNPSNGQFTVNFPNAPKSDYMLDVYNLSGLLVYKQNSLSDFPFNLNLEYLQPGVYFIKLSGTHRNAVTRIVVEQ